MPIDYPTIGLAGEVSCLKVLLPRDESKGVFLGSLRYHKKRKKRKEKKRICFTYAVVVYRMLF